MKVQSFQVSALPAHSKPLFPSTSYPLEFHSFQGQPLPADGKFSDPNGT